MIVVWLRLYAAFVLAACPVLWLCGGLDYTPTRVLAPTLASAVFLATFSDARKSHP